MEIEVDSENQAVTGMMQLQQGVSLASPRSQGGRGRRTGAGHNISPGLHAVQGLQQPLPRHLLAQHLQLQQHVAHQQDVQGAQREGRSCFS